MEPLWQLAHHNRSTLLTDTNDLLFAASEDLGSAVRLPEIFEPHRDSRFGQFQEPEPYVYLIEGKSFRKKFTTASGRCEGKSPGHLTQNLRNMFAEKHLPAFSLPEKKIRKVHVPEQVRFFECHDVRVVKDAHAVSLEWQHFSPAVHGRLSEPVVPPRIALP